MRGSNIGRISPHAPAQRRPGGSIERSRRKGHDVAIVRTEPRDVAPVITLPVRMHDNRVIQPLDVPVGTPLVDRSARDPESYDPEGYDPGPLARALMAEAAERL